MRDLLHPSPALGTGRARLGGWDESGHGYSGRWRRGRAAPRVAGYPTSPNRASSLHLRWELPAGAGAVVAASAALVVEAAPPVPDLYFWALQASFIDSADRLYGGGHVGLQWHRQDRARGR